MAALGPIQDDVNIELLRMRKDSSIVLFNEDACLSGTWSVRCNTAVLTSGQDGENRPVVCKAIGVVNPYLTHFVPPGRGISSIVTQRFFDLRFSIGKPFGFPAFEEAFDTQQQNLKVIIDALDIDDLRRFGVWTERSALERGGSVNFAHTILTEVSESSFAPADPYLWDLLKSCPARDMATRFSMETAIGLGTHELRPLDVYNGDSVVAQPEVRAALNNALVEVDFFLHYHSVSGFRASPCRVNIIASPIVPGVTMPGLVD